MPARFVLTFIFCFGVFSLRAQQNISEGSKPVYHEMFGAFSMPMGSFENADKGGAQNGWGIGLQQMKGVAKSDVYLSYCLAYTSQPYTLKGDFLNERFKGNYNIVNFLFGFGTRTKAPDSFYINFMGGFCYTALGGDLDYDALTFGMSPGAGLIIEKNFVIGLKYYYANPTFKYMGQQKISMLHFIAGVEF